MPTCVDSRRGISLLEAVIGLTIVGMTAIAALSAAAAEMRTAERSRRAIEAASLATQRLNLLPLLTRNQLLSLPDSIKRGRFDPPLDEYRWTTEITTRPDEQGIYDVVVHIEWKEGAYTVYTALYRQPPIVSQNGMTTP